VLLAARHLVDRTRHSRARADALLQLRKRLGALPDASAVTPELVELAKRLGDLREQLTRALGEVRSCSGCAAGHPEPFGHWPGGHCCGGDTANVFTDVELAALKLSGTTAGKLRAPRSDLAGCAFRGPTGCSLEARDRPTLCVRFLCRELEQELRRRGDLAQLRALHTELTDAFEQFAKESALTRDAASLPEPEPSSDATLRQRGEAPK